MREKMIKNQEESKIKFLGNIQKTLKGFSKKEGKRNKSLNEGEIVGSLDQEGLIPKEMLQGVAPIGILNPSDPKMLYWNNKDVEQLLAPKFIMGEPGSGKTTYLKLLSSRLGALRHTVVIFDFIKQCEFTKELEKSLDPGTYEVWDFSKEEFYNQFSFNYCELYRNFDENNYIKRQIVAALILNRVLRFLDAINENSQPLTVKAKYWIERVGKIVFVHKDQTLNDFIKALSNYEVRQSYIKRCEETPLNENGEYLISPDIIEEVKKLDKYDEDTKEWVTDEEKIGYILPQLKKLTSDPRIQKMLNNNTNAYDFREMILNPKIIMIRVPQQKNSNTGEHGYLEEIRAMITAFITFKLWIIKESLSIEGDDYELVENLLGEQVKRRDSQIVHMIYDEIHQFPQFAETLFSHLRELRAYRLGAIFSCHGMDNFRSCIQRGIARVDYDYLLFAPTSYESIDKLKDCFRNLDLQDIKEMKRGHLAIHSSTNHSYFDMILKRPGTIQEFLAMKTYLGNSKISDN